MKYETSAKLAQKADYEGGLLEFVFGYGLQPDDLPDDMPGEIRAYFRQLMLLHPVVDAIEQYLDKVVAEAPREGDK